MKPGDLIFYHESNIIALVITARSTTFDPTEPAWWIEILTKDGKLKLIHAGDNFTVIGDLCNWPEWHINHQ